MKDSKERTKSKEGFFFKKGFKIRIEGTIN